MTNDDNTQDLLAKLRESNRRARVGDRLVFGVGLAAAIVWVALRIGSLSGQATTLADRADVLSERLDARAADVAVLSGQVRNLGGTPAVPTPRDGNRVVVVDISSERLRQAVTAELQSNPPKPGPKPTVTEVTRIVAKVVRQFPGRDGRDAPPPSGAQIAAFVAGYCDPRGMCQGPPPSTEDVMAAVNRVIEENPDRFRGAKGDKGDDGESCPDGYEFRPFVAMTSDGGGYRDAVACVDPSSSFTPDPVPTDPGLLNPTG